ncbi:MAG: sigma-70 family RNA polymerase sigma factor [Firmicutes bacterium]|nr:sigma-70 family RNA polymerase sigma factor [Bacillota bacterium]MDY5585709.1 sigma-70 family RNA polymerase sigma factor [Eubacteriales bacterium]
MEDIDLIRKAKQGDETSLELLLAKFKPLACKIARKYFLAGQDEEDLYQEAMIGLFKAEQSFNETAGQDFKSFATLCINRQIQTAVKNSNRKKNKILNESISLNNQGGIDVYESDDEEQLYFIIPSSSPLPDDELIYKEKVNEIKNAIDQKLSTYERKVLSLYLKGLSYKEMGQILEKETKSIENCLSRIKSKLSYLK